MLASQERGELRSSKNTGNRSAIDAFLQSNRAQFYYRPPESELYSKRTEKQRLHIHQTTDQAQVRSGTWDCWIRKRIPKPFLQRPSAHEATFRYMFISNSYRYEIDT